MGRRRKGGEEEERWGGVREEEERWRGVRGGGGIVGRSEGRRKRGEKSEGTGMRGGKGGERSKGKRKYKKSNVEEWRNQRGCFKTNHYYMYLI